VTAVEVLRHQELAHFLRNRRERLTPEAAGLPRGRRRRTPGLRREEVAALAGVGVTWYTWLEQGRSIQPSAQVLGAIAATLRLDGTERAHLFTLAGVADPDPSVPEEPVGRAVLAMLEALTPNPAYVLSERWDVLAWNEGATALLLDFGAVPPARRNILRLIFTHPELRSRLPDWDLDAGRHVGMFRAAMAQHAGEPDWQRLLADLRAESPEFAAIWERHDLARPETRIKRFCLPAVGMLRLEATIMWLGERPGARLIVYVPADDETTLGLRRLVASGRSGS
jgi:transcriptional regulator with XRE-family HTH domain